jgi:hypothetical protein
MQLIPKSVYLLGVVIVGLSVGALGQQGVNMRSAPAAGPPVPAGPLVLDPEPWDPVSSLDQLIRASQLIVDGTVASVLPAINLNPAMPGQVETDSIVLVNQAIWGNLPSVSQILLMQTGGTQGKWVVSVAGDPLVQAGERYILFLDPDVRKSIPNSAGVPPETSVAPRYYTVDHANGKAKIAATGAVQFPSGAISQLQGYDNTDVSAFVAAVQARLAILYRKAPPYPVGVTPLTAPPPGQVFPPPGPKK